MTGLESNGRHLTAEALRLYVDQGSRALVPVPGDPVVMFVIDGSSGSMCVETPWDGVAVPELSAYEHLDSDVVFREGINWARLKVNGRQFLDDAYPLFATLADRLQLEDDAFSVAVTGVLDGFETLFTKAVHLSREREIGLYGELLVLERLLSRVSAETALATWLGPEAAEHDFALPIGDLEVKTTGSENRIHWISGLDQLSPSPGRTLFLLSLQITLAGAGPGRSLEELIAEIRGALGASTPKFDDSLRSSGWRDDHGRRWQRWRLRSHPLCLSIACLPALTSDTLAAAGVDIARLHDVRYRIDVTGLPAADISTNDFAPTGAN
ncbi:PD-(D/E)XK motif protein [Modestobacter sp. VKM Ac-2978]|uniref:PD-(D/E)XK motif protein n=1 Tax=Modestobacter sp. VKM Ac-2978 TaxID=3004132 RepID=UPI0022AA35B8|nr:PD-(D/E)XK motif protein [Modestobacter sp. VKM Ac-2978]MCZ2849130.1 PD-(D/E)XK motif protein [Modestobacter sp. VKM Ac-2978]